MAQFTRQNLRNTINKALKSDETRSASYGEVSTMFRAGVKTKDGREIIGEEFDRLDGLHGHKAEGGNPFHKMRLVLSYATSYRLQSEKNEEGDIFWLVVTKASKKNKQGSNTKEWTKVTAAEALMKWLESKPVGFVDALAGYKASDFEALVKRVKRNKHRTN